MREEAAEARLFEAIVVSAEAGRTKSGKQRKRPTCTVCGHQGDMPWQISKHMHDEHPGERGRSPAAIKARQKREAIRAAHGGLRRQQIDAMERENARLRTYGARLRAMHREGTLTRRHVEDMIGCGRNASERIMERVRAEAAVTPADVELILEPLAPSPRGRRRAEPDAEIVLDHLSVQLPKMLADLVDSRAELREKLKVAVHRAETAEAATKKAEAENARLRKIIDRFTSLATSLTGKA